MKDRYMANNEKTVAIFSTRGWLYSLACFLLLAGAPNLSDAQCSLKIESVYVGCGYNNGSSNFTVEVEVSWAAASGAPIQLKVGGQTQEFTPVSANGAHTFSGFSLPSPGFGYPVAARFTDASPCRDFSTADAIACTPACPGTPTSIGGQAWNDTTPDGVFDGEPGQPNIKVEAYDCEGLLRGAAFTNADGHWSISGLNAGEQYRVEFSARQVPGMSPALAGPGNGSPVQFVAAGDCGVNAAFIDQSADDCSRLDNPDSANCSDAPATLDWANYTEGSNPFSQAPFSVSVDGDKVYWARTTEGATPYAHRVYHTLYGGQEAFYLLEMEADNNAPGNESGVGVVFAFDRPVAELTFSLLDIDISGNAIDRASVQGYLGGAPVSLSSADITAGSAVSVLEPYLFEGATLVDDASAEGNVTIRFGEPVDQLAIALYSVSPANGGSEVQSIGVGNISWCSGQAPLSPACTRIFDWMSFPDNSANPTPYLMEDVELNVRENDPFGIAGTAAFAVDNGLAPQGGQRGFWAIGMNAAAKGQYVESTLAFSQPVSQLSFSILGIGQVALDGIPSLSYQDQVIVRGFLNGEEAPLSLSDITAGTGVLGGVVSLSSPNEYIANRAANGASADGNISLRFPQEVDSVVIRLLAGPDGPSNPGSQQVGLSDINFCICTPAPLQVGDLVWEDENGNGIQDACEPPLANLPLSLFDESGILLATTRSDAEGRYHFTRSGTAGEYWLADGQLQPGTTYFITLGGDDNDPADGYLLLNGELYLLTTRFAGIGSNPFMNDSDPDPNNLSLDLPGMIPDGLPYIKFATGDNGQVNPTLDAGFRAARFDLALRLVLNEQLTPPPFSPGDIVNYSIILYNQGMIPAQSPGVADFFPSDVLSLEDNVNWSVNNGVALSRGPLPDIMPGDSLVLDITFRIKTSFTGDTIINRAEIYQAANLFGLNDFDSSPDLIADNDAGGAPGSEADDAIMGDGTGPVNGTSAATDEDDHDVALIVVDGAPAFDLALDLSVIGDGPFYPGDEVTFAIELINEGVMDASLVQLNNYIPNGLLLNDSDWTAANGVARLNVPVDVLPTGSSVFREITFQIAPGFTGNNIVNTVEIAGAANAAGEADGDSTPANQVAGEDDQASAQVAVSPVFDLSLKKEVVGSGPFSPGGQVTFSLMVTNEGSVPATNVQISDFVPAGLTLNNSNWSVTNNAARLNNLIPNIAPGNTVTRQITFRIDSNYPRTSIINSAEIYAAQNGQGLDDRDSTPGNGSTQEDDDDNVTINVQQPTPVFDLALKKEVNYAETPGPFHPGDYISFNITVINEGNIKAKSLQVVDYIPDGAILADAGWISYGNLAIISSPISSLEAGASVTLTIRMRIDENFDGQELVNNAEIYSVFNDDWLDDADSSPDSGIGDNEDDEGTAVVPIQQPLPVFDLSLSKRVKTSVTPGPFYPGSTVTFSIRVSNEGNIDAESVSIMDYIPPGLELADANWSQVFGSAVLNNPITGLAAGATASVDITFTIAGNFTGTSINNRAEINSAGNAVSMPDEDSSPANGQPAEDDMGSATLEVVQTYDLALSKTLNASLTPGPFHPGGQVSYNLTVYNQGSLAANNIQLYDFYPPGLLLNDNNWQAVQGNILRLANPIPTLAPGQSATVAIHFDISPDAMHGDSLVNCAELGASTNVAGLPDVDSNPGNGSHDEDDDDTETIQVTFPKRFDLALSKSVNTSQTPPPHYPGSNVSYRITVKNEGDAAAENIQVQDYIPQGLILTSGNWSALGSMAMLNNPIASLQPGDSAIVDISFAISPVFQGTSLSNYAEIASAGNVSNQSDDDSTPGNGSAGAGEDDYDGATITVSRQDFDLALRKRLKASVTPGPFVPGSTVTFEIEISNEADLTAQNIQVREYFPSGLLLADPNWNAVGNVAELVFPIGSLAPGATTVVDVTFTVAPGFNGSNLTNYAEVGSAFNILGYDDMDSTPGNGSLGPDEDDYDGATITVLQQEFDLSLAKALKVSATPGPFFPGSLVTYRITVTNEGDLEAQNVQLRDYIPLGLSLADNNWTLNGSMAVRSIGNLQPGASVSFDISFTISAAFAGSVLTNYAEVGAAGNSMGIADKDSTPGNGAAAPNEDDYDSAAIDVIQSEFDLALTKELNTSLTPGPFVPGSAVTFRLTLANEGDLAAQNIQLRDYVPAGLILADNNWTLNGSTAVRAVGTLQPGASLTVNITFTISSSFSGLVIANFAEVGAAANIYGLADKDSTPANGPAGPNEDDYDSAAIDVIQSEFDLALTKELNTGLTPGPFVPGSAVTFRLTVINEGEVAAQNIQLWDYIPLGLILADNNWSSNGNLASRTISNLAPGASTAVNITFTVAPNYSGTAIANYAEIGGADNIYGLDDRDSTPGNSSSGAGEDDFDGASIDVVQQPFDLTLTKELKVSATPGPFYPGSAVTFRITVTNEGGIAAQNVQVRDYIPLSLILTDNNWTLNGSMALRSIGALQPGASASVDITFTISPNFTGFFITNYAEIGSATNAIGLGDTDSTPANGSAGLNEDDFDSAGITVSPPQQFDLTLSKSVSASTPGPYAAGSPVTFRLTVTNQGNVAAQNIQLWDYLPAGLTLSDNGWTQNGGVASLNSPIASLAPGASQTVEIDFVVAPGFGGTQVVNYAEVGSASNASGLDDIDSTPGNGASGANEDDYDSAGIDIIVPPMFDLALSKSVSASTPGPYAAGSAVTFELTVANQGNVAAQSIQLWDYLPAGLTLSDNGWTLNGGIASLNNPIASLAPGTSQIVEIDFIVAPGFAGTQAVNYAEINAAFNGSGLDDTDSTPGNGAAGSGEDDYDSASVDIVVPPSFDLALSKSVSSSTPGPYAAGSAVTFRLRVTNQGNVAAQDIQLWDYLPAGLTLSDNGWTQNGAVASLNNPIASLAPGATVDVEIDFVVAPGFGGTQIVNYAEIAAASNGSGLNDTDSTPGNGAAGPSEDDYDDSSINIIIPPLFDLALSKSVSTSTPGPYAAGSAVTFLLTVSNEGNVAAQSIQLWDYLPAGLTLSDNTWTQNGGVASLNSPIASLAPGASQTVEIDFVVAPGFGGTQVVNYAEVGSASNASGLGDTDSTPGNGASGANEDDYDSAGIDIIVPPMFDLALSKSVSASTPGPYAAGSAVTFRLTVTNQGNVAAQSIQLWDYLPAGLTLSDNGWTLNGGIASLNSPIASLAPGASQTVEIDFIVAPGFAGTQAVNYAEINAAFNGSGLDDTDSTPGNGAAGSGEDDYDSASVDIVVPPSFDLALSKSVSSSTPGPYAAGSAVTFRLRVTNQGNVAAQDIQLWDYLPAGLTLSDNGWTQNGAVASLNNPIASLAPGATVDVEIDFVVAPGFGGTQIVNYAEIAAASNGSGLNDTDSTPGNGAAGPSEDDYDDSRIDIITLPSFDLALSKSVSSSTPGPYMAGSAVTFELTLTNQGNVAAQNIQLWDYLPAGLTLSDNGWTQNGGEASLNSPIASLAPGASQTVEIDFVVAPGFAGTQVVNFAEIFAAANGQGLNDTDSTPGNGAAGGNEDDFDSAAINISAAPRFDLALRKQLRTAVTPGPFSPGSPVTFRITIFNQGNVPAYNVEITDYIPAGLTLAGGGWAQSGNRATHTIQGPIAANGGSTSVDISFVVDPNFAGSAIVNYAEISAADDDTNPDNTPMADVDSQYDNDNTNDAGGQPNSPADDAINGNGSGPVGGGLADSDEDDHDPALIVIGNCPNAGVDGTVDICLTCTSNTVTANLPAALGGNPAPGGTWTDLDGAGASLANPSNVSLNGLPSGDYRFRYTVGGQNGCPVSTATVTVSLASNLDYACNGTVNVPLGTRCEVLVVPDMILEGGSDGCAQGLVVNLIGPNGQSLGDVITVAQAGQTLIAEVLDPFCGLVCWGYVYVQDFTPPAISCPVQDVDLVCSDLDSILNNPASLAITGAPEIFDTCVQNTVSFQDEVVMTPDCVDRQINRVFTVTDPLGNSAQCTQAITVRNPTFNDLLPLPSLVAIPCDSSFAVDQNGNPHPSVTGYPMVQTYYGTYPLDQAFCALGASYTDSAPIVVCDGTTRFIRRWDVLDWCSTTGNNILQLTQSIKVGDVAGPVVSCPEIDFNGDGYPDPLEFSTLPYDCTAAFSAPLPNVTDNCSGWEVRTDIIADEVVAVTNQYGIITGYDTVATILATILPGQSRYVSGIPVGCYRFRYKVTDDCNNFTILECDFCVVDDVEPAAVCNDTLNISIGGQGVGRVYAVDVNEGSTDNCGIDSLLVRRRFDLDPATCDTVAPYFSDWAPYVDFNCCDVNQTATIELLVIDVHGNQNTCWLDLLVKDMVRPVCSAPNAVTVSCTTLPANFDPYDTNQLQTLFGAATAQDGCGNAIAVEQPPAVNLDQCGSGTVIRTFQAVDLSGNLSQNSCTQQVAIQEEFNYEIKFPKDFTTNCTVPSPDTVIYTSFGCDLLSVSVTDEVFTPLAGATGPECYKIFRKYRVLNWCEYDGISDAVVIGRNEDCDGITGDEDVWVVRRPNGSFVDRDNNPNNNIPAFGAKGTGCDGTTNPTGYWRTVSSVGLWEYTQIIKVMDTIPPQVSFTAPDAFCSYDPVNCDGQVSYPFTVFEDCSANGLAVEVFLDANADGLIDQDLTNTGALAGSYPNFTIQGEFPIGDHAFIVQASDGCGNNTASATLPFQVADCEPPAFTCLNGLSFNLMPLPPNTDFDGDGDFDVAGAAIWANDFIQSASDCSDDTIAYSINLVGQMPDINQRALYFTCEDTGTIAIQIYIWDSADNPNAVQPDGTTGGFNYAICDTYVTVQNNNNACTPVVIGPIMAGLIAREDNMGVEGVEVSLSGPQSQMMNTGVDGRYQFDSLETGYDYTIRPYLNTGHRNGISTFDLLILQQHLLGVQPLDSPYKRIAADANRSGAITTLDMIQIQQLILGEILEFPNNTSWRFVEKDFVFPVPTNPWFTSFPEVISVNDLMYPMMANDFVAIKVGDVNNSAVTTNLLGVDGRSFDGTFYLKAPALEVRKGEVVEVPVAAENLDAIRGCQFTLEFDQRVLELIDVEYGLAEENSLGLHGVAEGYITASWYRKDGQDYPEGEPLFTLHLRAYSDGAISNLLNISSRYTLAEAYTPGDELLEVALNFDTGKPIQAAAFRLYQNRPNPFSEGSVIGFELPESGPAQLTVFDLNGRLLYQRRALFSKGYNELILNRGDLWPAAAGGGVLYYRLQMGNRVATRKMIMLE